MAEERIIWDAKFNPAVTTYWLLSGALALAVTVFGILLLPIWFLVGWGLTQKYLSTYRCTLTNRSLKVAKGWFVKIEKTVPLDRITDIGLIQGPIMRLFDIEALSVETAGQSTQSSLVQLAGICEGRRFRDAILQQRDSVVGSDEDRKTQEVPAVELTDDVVAHGLLTEIRDVLTQIESKLDKPAD